MTTNTIIQILQEAALYLKRDFDDGQLQIVRMNFRIYEVEDFPDFKRDLVEAARKIDLMVIEQSISKDHLQAFIQETRDPLVVFQAGSSTLEPHLLAPQRKQIRLLLSGKTLGPAEQENLLQSDSRIVALLITPYKSISGETAGSATPTTPVKRLLRLLATEKRDIAYILIYAMVIGLLSLALPLGLQSTIEFVSGGVFFSSIYILIGLVILGVLATGVLQIVQITMVEQLQRRVFVKAALEFAYRIPRLRLEAIAKNYAPELVNRFFDVITIQKGLPKFLLDLTAAVIQVFFGLLLLSLYHPFFVFFSLFLVAVIITVFYITGPRGLSSSIQESKYKYKVVQWLEELARTIRSFKLAGNTELPIRKTDELAGSYIRYRKKHFGILRAQFSFIVFFKVTIIGGLLIMGTILVVDRQITLGQFVASEVIIILLLNSVEKIILYADVVYDLLTAVDKVSQVTDLPIERSGGFDLPKKQDNPGYHISITDLNYRYRDNVLPTLTNINLEIGAGERVCICGSGGSGKSTLTNIIGGLYADYTGGISINKFSLRDLDITRLRNKIAKNISPEDIFEGSIYENITIGRTTLGTEEVMAVVEQVGLSRSIRNLPHGLNTSLTSGGKGLSSSTLHRLILARCLAKKPELLILNDFFPGLSKADKLDLIGCAINPENSWTLIVESNDPLLMVACDRVIVMDEGRIVADGSYPILLKEGVIAKYFD